MGRFLDEISAPVPVGGLLQLAGASGPNPTIDGAEYLKTSVLKAIAGYEGLASSAVDITAVVATPAMSTVGAANGALLAANGWLYGMGSSGASVPYKTSDPINVAWTSSGGGGANMSDGFTLGARAIFVTNNGIISLLNGARTDITPTVPQTLGAANDAGTLAVTVANLNGVAGHITTSTDGLAWTDRTSTGGPGSSNGIANCDWCAPAGLFLYVNPNGKVYTAANGYTLTDRGAIAGATAASASNAFRTRARSATSNVLLLTLTIGGTAAQYIVRTTDGSNYSAVLASTALQLDGFEVANALQITRVDGKYAIYQASASGVPGSVFYVSADDGLTWQKSSVPVNPALPTTALALLAPGNSGQILGLYSTTALTVLPGLTATHVGIAKPLADAAPYYVRVK